MEDVLTEIPPPSRFFQEDLNNFVHPALPLPSPFFLFSLPKLNEPLHPSLLIIALSPASLHFFSQISSKKLIGSLILPEIPLSGISVEPAIGDKSCNLYALSEGDNPVLLVSVQCPVAAERCHIVAKMLIKQVVPERVLILGSVQSQTFRGRLSPDETFAYKLETSTERRGSGNVPVESSLIKGLEYFPSGSVIDGLAAALLGQCEMRNIKGTLVVSWPEINGSVVSLLKAILLKNVFPIFNLSLDGNYKEDERSAHIKDQPFDSELYT